MKRWIGIVVAAVGIAVALVFALAEMVGLGTDVGTFGWKQLTGTIVGAVIFVVGLVLAIRAKE